jgi:voltage-dependent potassium channel beta subunit
MQAAWEAGCNFFDNAEAYADGTAEVVMGRALKELRWPRHSYVVSTKFYRGLHRVTNMRKTLNRKYLLQAIDRSLERLQLDFVDLLYCHRADEETPIEETVWAMNDIISQGKALYWGTSEWTAHQVRAAWEIAERHHLRKPVAEQPQYNLLKRDHVERELRPLCEEIGLGLTTWSPLASGLLTGKYLDRIPSNSRGAQSDLEYLQDHFNNEGSKAKIRKLQPIADEIGCSLAQFAIAWCATNPGVSAVITGASSPEQVAHNFQALDVINKLDARILERIDHAMA